jgi:LEA14-like dessication related protein
MVIAFHLYLQKNIKMRKLHFSVFILLCLLAGSCTMFQEVKFTRVENINITNFTKEDVEAEISARIINPNFYSFTIHESDVEAIIGGINVGKINLTDKVHIKGDSEELYTFKIHSKLKNLDLIDYMRIAAIAMSKNVKVELKGYLKAGKGFFKKEIPVNIVQEIPIGKK